MDTSAGNRDWIAWQLADSAFPTGGFAHSSGLEAAMQHGELARREDLRAWVSAGLHQAAHASLPFVLAAFDSPACLHELDETFEAFTSNHVANRASRAQGQALLALSRKAFDVELPDPPCGHYPVLFGMICRLHELPRETVARLFLFTHLRGLLASAVRLGLIGPIETQRWQYALGQEAEELARTCQQIAVEDAAQTAPILELCQGAQDRLYSRLFQS